MVFCTRMFRLEAVPRCGSFCRGSDPMVGRLSVAVRLLQCVSPSFVLGALEAHPGIPVQPVEPNASMPPTNVLSTAPRVAQPTPNRRATVGRAETALPGPATPQRPPHHRTPSVRRSDLGQLLRVSGAARCPVKRPRPDGGGCRTPSPRRCPL